MFKYDMLKEELDQTKKLYDRRLSDINEQITKITKLYEKSFGNCTSFELRYIIINKPTLSGYAGCAHEWMIIIYNGKNEYKIKLDALYDLTLDESTIAFNLVGDKAFFSVTASYLGRYEFWKTYYEFEIDYKNESSIIKKREPIKAGRYKIGQIISQKENEMEFETCGEQHKLLKGDRVIVGADRNVHSLVDEKTVPLLEGSEVKGIDANGIAEYVCGALIDEYKIDKLIGDDKTYIIRTIENALEKIL